MVMMWVQLFLGCSVFFPCDVIFSSHPPPRPLLLLCRPYFEMKAKYYLQLEVRDDDSDVIYLLLDPTDPPFTKNKSTRKTFFMSS